MQTRMSVLATFFAVAMVAGTIQAHAQYAPIGGLLVNSQPRTGTINTSRPQPPSINRPQPPTQATSGGWNRVSNVSGSTSRPQPPSPPTTNGWDVKSNKGTGSQPSTMSGLVQQQNNAQRSNITQQTQGLLQQQSSRPQPPVMGNQVRPQSGLIQSSGSQRAFAQSAPQSPRPQTSTLPSQTPKRPAAPPHRNH
ncbi:hypothetical protein [Granulicella paludicola]|uniref:hypothetical protein n=1 Tax=Granulicella paludicola TaxID=474951 RepID=UPI0021E0B79A|nr:hypothetical protein [Granulicella paludicola]